MLERKKERKEEDGGHETQVVMLMAFA